MNRTYTKDWCQGFCTLCGTGCAEHSQDLYESLQEIKKLRQALEFYANMDNRVPGTSSWDQEVVDLLGNSLNVSITCFNKPSKIDTDMGKIAQEALEGK